MKDPSFFLTNKTGAPQDGAILYGARATGAAPGTKSMWNSTSRVGGSPGKSSGKTSGKSRMIGTSSSRFSSDLSYAFFLVTCARKTWHPFLNILLSLGARDDT
ncbi:hypothetical protein Tco_1204850 [Tanacetum coccineum]